jgi:hypothetical protein
MKPTCCFERCSGRSLESRTSTRSGFSRKRTSGWSATASSLRPDCLMQVSCYIRRSTAQMPRRRFAWLYGLLSRPYPSISLSQLMPCGFLPLRSRLSYPSNGFPYADARMRHSSRQSPYAQNFDPFRRAGRAGGRAPSDPGGARGPGDAAKRCSTIDGWPVKRVKMSEVRVTPREPPTQEPRPSPPRHPRHMARRIGIGTKGLSFGRPSSPTRCPPKRRCSSTRGISVRS